MDKEYRYKWGVWPEVNQQIQLFNTGLGGLLEGLLEGLSADPQGVRFAYDAVYKIICNPNNYGGCSNPKD